MALRPGARGMQGTPKGGAAGGVAPAPCAAPVRGKGSLPRGGPGRAHC